MVLLVHCRGRCMLRVPEQEGAVRIVAGVDRTVEGVTRKDTGSQALGSYRNLR